MRRRERGFIFIDARVERREAALGAERVEVRGPHGVRRAPAERLAAAVLDEAAVPARHDGLAVARAARGPGLAVGADGEVRVGVEVVLALGHPVEERLPNFRLGREAPRPDVAEEVDAVALRELEGLERGGLGLGVAELARVRVEPRRLALERDARDAGHVSSGGRRREEVLVPGRRELDVVLDDDDAAELVAAHARVVAVEPRAPDALPVAAVDDARGAARPRLDPGGRRLDDGRAARRRRGVGPRPEGHGGERVDVDFDVDDRVRSVRSGVEARQQVRDVIRPFLS
mmetsp:Transcript_28232/g.87339  ORF Transcript_28232/g.87339 Transcript_28232/m.87339 type:complete len:288 (+) Transcript_28232:315-1178(+)